MFKHLCLNCGYSGKPKGCKVCGRIKKKKTHYKSDGEMARDAGLKDREQFLDWVESGLEGFGMPSTGSEVIDDAASERKPSFNKPVPPFQAY